MLHPERKVWGRVGEYGRMQGEEARGVLGGYL
jgi:hypothetical protein